MKNVYSHKRYLIYTRMLTVMILTAVTDGQKGGTIFLIPYIFLILKYVPT